MGRVGGEGRWPRLVAGVAVGALLSAVGVVPPAAAGPVSAATGPGSASDQAPARPSGPVDLVGGADSIATDVNDHGLVVGWYILAGQDPVNAARAFRWTARRGLVDIGPGAAEAVNESGVVVGTRLGGAGTIRATRWTAAGQAQDLGLDGTSYATDINDRGTIVGYGSTGAFVIEPGVAPEPLANPSEIVGPHNQALGINNRGDIVGWAFDEGSGRERPVLWQGRDHTPTVLPTRRDDYEATDINDRGTIVGWALAYGVGRQAVTWVGRRHREVDVGPPGVDSQGLAINDRGQVVGVRLESGDGFRWDPRTDRTTILTGLTDIYDEPRAINDRGVVVGYSRQPEFSPVAVIFASR